MTTTLPANNKLSVRVDGNQIAFYSPNDDEDNVIITFHRTLRIPDDGKIYPLPPSLGSFPVRRVDDYLDRVPETWKKQGGVFIPLFQREAMWLEYLNVSSSHPHALKVAVGKVNALSGEIWDEDMKTRNVQDYCVTPLQPWLDGINAGDGFIKQFVAMPLGGGYTVEAQVTGEEKVGGAQIVCYNPHEQQRLDKFKPTPKVVTRSYNNNNSNSNNNNNNNITSIKCNEQKQQQPTITSSNSNSNSIFGSIKTFFSSPPPPPPSASAYSSMAIPESMDCVASSLQGLSMNDDCEYECENSYSQQESLNELSYALSSPVSSSSSSKSRSSSSNSKSVSKESVSRKSEKKQESSSNKAQELGLASGGKIKQQVVEDPYGASFWDVSTKSRIFVHIVNSEMYKQITGEDVPPTPISAQTYSSYNYPWFDYYTEGVNNVGKSNILSNVKTVKEMDNQKFGNSQQDDSSVSISNVHTTTTKFEDVRDGEW